MLKKVLVVAVCLVVVGLGVAQASPVQIPGAQSAQVMRPENSEHLWYNEEYTLSIGAQYDSVTERELESDNEAELNAVSAKISLDYKDRMSIYTTLGQTSDAMLTERSGSNTYKYFFEDSFVWSVGITAKLYTFEDIGLDVIGDASYRDASEMEVDELDINGTRYSKSQFTAGSSIEADWEEWQVALGVSKKFDQFTPYAGIKYSDVDAKGRATVSGTTYDTSAEADQNVGIFVGATVEALDGLTFDIQGRFIDETAFTLSANYKF